MSRQISPVLVLPVVLVLTAGCSKPVSYSKDVFPILEANCLSCHQVGEEGHTASGLSMETYDDLMKGTKFGPIIVPGSDFSSTLAILIEHKADPSINMPHKKDPLSEAEIEVINAWINQGAKNN